MQPTNTGFLYKVNVIDAKYDVEVGALYIFLYFVDMGFYRIVILSKSDITDKGKPVSDEKMYQTAEMYKKLKGKIIKWEFRNDINMKEPNKEEMQKLYKEFTNSVSETMNEVIKELQDPEKQIERKIASVLRKEKYIQDLTDKFKD